MAELLDQVAASAHAVVFPWTSNALRDLLIKFDLSEHGIATSSRVALLLPNGPLAATVTLATILRYCAVPLDPLEPAAALASRLSKSRARCLVAVPELSEVAQLAATAASLPLVILEPAPLMLPGGFIVPRPALHGTAPAGPSVDDTAPVGGAPPYNALDDDVLLLHTSGTTGAPRRVRHTLRTLLAAASALAENVALSIDDVGLNMMPTHHVGGLVCNLLAPLHAGCRMLFCPRFDPAEWWRLVHSREPVSCRRCMSAHGPTSFYSAAISCYSLGSCTHAACPALARSR